LLFSSFAFLIVLVIQLAYPGRPKNWHQTCVTLLTTLLVTNTCLISSWFWSMHKSHLLCRVM